MGYYENIENGWKSFDDFLNHIKPMVTEEQYFYAYSARNAYVAFTELNNGKTTASDNFKSICRVIYNIIKMFTRKNFLIDKSEIVVLEIHPEQDAQLAEKMGFPLLKMKSCIYPGYHFFRKWKALRDCFRIYFLMRKEKNLLVKNILYVLGPIIRGAHIYEDIDLFGLKRIITQRDRYPQELAVLKRAKENGIYNMKVDYFVIMGNYTQNTIFCDHYYCPNKVSRNILRSFEQNNQVEFIEGGFPFWDVLAEYSYQPQESPRIITFFTQYGHDFGIYENKGPEFYIEEIIDSMPKDMHLHIKVHPLDDTKVYQKYKSDRVHILKHGTVDNWEQVSISTFCFSIFSAALLQAKHICRNSCFLNYYPESIRDFEYNRLEGTVDLIRSKEELKAILKGEKETTSQEDFVRMFNSAYPNSTKRLKEIIINS